MSRTCNALSMAMTLLALAACGPEGSPATTNAGPGPDVDAGPGPEVDGGPAPDTMAPATYNYQLADDYSAEHGGLALLVMLDSEIVYEQYHGGHTADLPLHIASATKSFWGVAAAAMIEDGLLSSFDELASDTLTEWQGQPLKRMITVRHLLSLTSGLAEDVPALQGEDGTAEDKYAYAIGLGLIAQPGTKFRYGPSHFYAFGELMKRKLAGMGLDPLEYLEQRILEPIGLEHGTWRRDPSGNPHIPNGAYLTARNWMRFGQLLLQQGEWEGQQIVDFQLLAQCFAGAKANPGYGLTFWLNLPGGAELLGEGAPQGSAGGAIYHDGHPDIYMAAGAGRNLLIVVPELNMVVLRQAANPEGQDSFDTDHFFDLLLDG